ncbi:MAG: mycofactocin radical SAM maturase [Candidatus Lambdaproteobacteria bacterium]|nr:mycofactocin radical SAM maturase [Candidatus Lambdaproteobacteria bacterium]
MSSGNLFRNEAVTRVLREQGLSAPLTVTWEVTNRCNLACSHCLSDSGPGADLRGELDLAEAKAVVDQLAAARVFQIHFGGGEPFLYPGFLDLLRHAQARGLCCLCISTNGTRLDEPTIAALEALGGVYLQISLDGADEGACDAIRGPGAHRRALAALRRLEGRRIVRTVNFVYCRTNAGDLVAMHALALAHGATLRVTRLKPAGRGRAAYEALRPTAAQQADLHAWLQGHPDVLTGDTFFHLNALGGRPLGGFTFCGAARLTCLITPRGDVYPCAFTQTPRFLAGNLRRQDFAAIWAEAPVFREVFRRPAEGACTSCSAFGGCGGGCPAVKDALAGRLDVPDPDCVLDEAARRGQPQALCAG